jgi:hypothetical protein
MRGVPLTILQVTALCAALLALSAAARSDVPGAAAPTQTFPLQPYLTGDARIVTVILASTDNSAFELDASALFLSLTSLDHPGTIVRLPSATRGRLAGVVPPPGSPLAELTDATPVALVAVSISPSVAPGMYRVAVQSHRPPERHIGAVPYPDRIYVSTAQEQPDRGLIEAQQLYLGKTIFLMLPSQWHAQLECKGPSQHALRTPAADGSAKPSDLLQQLRAFATKPPPDSGMVSFESERGTPWRVVSVRRSLGRVEDGYFNNEDSAFIAFEPLVMELAPSFARRPNGANDSVAASPGQERFPRATYLRVFADPWEAARAISLQSPFDHPEWPAQFRSAVTGGSILPGMTHEMVANVLGYPSEYGTIDKLDRLKEWDYDDPAPWAPTVTFDHDRVIRYTPGSAPP